MHERVVMKSVWIILYLLLICTLNQVHYGQNSEGSRWVLSDLDTLKEASSQNKPFAQAVLALAYVHGDKGLNISMENAHKLAKISADSGHWLGIFTLGYLHRFEPLGPKPEEVRLRYLQAFQDPDGQMVKLAARKDPIASYVLGEIFTSDEVRPNIVPDLQLAARHYEISSQGGYQPASVQFALFKLHAIVDEGMGIQRDAVLGINLLEQASRQKLPAAHHYLGRSYFKGDGVGSDLEMALVHFQAAADRGYGLSQLTVADFYAYGVTGPPKVDIALRYARLALNYNETSALEKIAEYQKILSGDSNASLATTSPELPKMDANLWMIFRNHHHLEMIRLHLHLLFRKPLDCHRLTQQIPSKTSLILSRQKLQARVIMMQRTRLLLQIQVIRFQIHKDPALPRILLECLLKKFVNRLKSFIGARVYKLIIWEHINTLQNLPIVEMRKPLDIWE